MRGRERSPGGLDYSEISFLSALAAHMLKLECYRNFSASPLPGGKHFACLTGDKSQDSKRLKLYKLGVVIHATGGRGAFSSILITV